MRNELSSIECNRWTDARGGVVKNVRGLSYFREAWQEKSERSKATVRSRRTGQDYHAVYHLSNGTAVTIEQLVIREPLQSLFGSGIYEFSIEDIRLDCLLLHHIELSWKQVRDALYRLDHGKLMFRHVRSGVYTFKVD